MLLAAATLITSIAPRGLAQNIDLAAVPTRDTVQLTIYNAEDLTLVRETRVVTFSPGTNTLQFSWANTLIDPTSVQIEFLSEGHQLSLIDTVYPHDRNQMLYWAVESEFDGEATIQITYFTSGISWSADYVVTASNDETQADIKGFVTVTNNSGEDYADATIRMVVGRVNLVERIAELARRGFGVQPGRGGREVERLRRNTAVAGALMEADSLSASAPASAPQVIKEGLSEYFIFTVDGEQTVPNQWSKRIASTHTDDAPIELLYRYRPRQYGNQLVKMFIMTNDSEAGLGESPLPDGVVRIFKENGRDGLSYIGQQQTQYIAITDKLELNLGADPNVIFELVSQSATRDNIWIRDRNRPVRRVEDGAEGIDDRSTVIGWQSNVTYLQHIRNYTGREIQVEVRRNVPGDSTWTSATPTTNHNAQTAEYTVTVAPGEDAAVRYLIATRVGHNAEQNRLLVEAGEVPAAFWTE